MGCCVEQVAEVTLGSKVSIFGYALSECLLKIYTEWSLIAGKVLWRANGELEFN